VVSASGPEIGFGHCTTTRVVTIPNTSVPALWSTENDHQEKAPPLGCSLGAITRRDNVAAYPTIDHQNARNEATMSKSEHEQQDVFGGHALHVGAGFKENERGHVVEALSTLGPHLGRWDPHDVVVDVSLQDRGGKEQRVTLRTSLPGLPPLVAVADNPDLTRALGEAKHELIRQIEHQKSEREPMNNRRLRSATVRHPNAPTP
jgi:ribosome-associated translation inhibitor RaiA